MESARIDIPKVNIIWALQEAGISINAALDTFPFLKKAWNEEEKGTYKQYQGFCDKIHIPFPYLLISHPQSLNLSDIRFRTIDNQDVSISPNLRQEISLLESQMNWMSDYREHNDYLPVDYLGKYHSYKDNISYVAQEIRTLLGIEANWYRKYNKPEDGYDYFVRLIERQGCLVMSASHVANNTKQTISLEDCRGLVLTDSYAPLIFINSSDTIHARTFTLLHEFTHLLLENEADLMTQDIYEESNINRIVSEVMIPKNEFMDCLRKGNNDLDLSNLGKYFNISASSAAMKLYHLGLISKEKFQEALETGKEVMKKKAGKGGSFYFTKASQTSPAFAVAVFNSVESSALGMFDACRLLGIPPKGYLDFKDKMIRRAIR